jgi:RimJ/RimL family protein N-acetyltransferase
VQGWKPPPAPPATALSGARVTLEPLDPDAHAGDLFDSYRGHDQVWDYLPYGPFTSMNDQRGWIAEVARQPDPRFYAIRNTATGRAEGVASYLRITPAAGSIEVGHINFSPALQGTTAATEAMYLMMRWAFETGYRRYEWKCDALNAPSRRAARRLGFSFEGVFRQATVVKGRNRDTAWFSVLDREWPELRVAFETWLAPDNFVEGRQVRSLSALTAPLLAPDMSDR